MRIKGMQTNLEEIEGLNKRMETKLEENEKKIRELSKVKELEESLLDLESIMKSLLRNGIHFKTCADLRATNPFLQSGMYWIDPDGQGIGDDPIRVFCDMTNGTVQHFYLNNKQ